MKTRFMLGTVLGVSLAAASGCEMILDIGAVPDAETLSSSPDAGTPDSTPVVEAAAGSTANGGAPSTASGGAPSTASGGPPSTGGADSGPSCDVAQCQAMLAATITLPVGCAAASCDPVTHSCSFAARDADGDGHGAAACTAAGLVVTTGDDCDDSDPAVYPSTTAACSETATGQGVSFPGGTPQGLCALGTKLCQADGKFAACMGVKAPGAISCTSSSDNDCDGKADNTECGVCTAGETATCYDGPSGSQGKGRCRAGTHGCVLNGSTTSWGPCTGEVLPASADTCDQGNDDNCNGTANQGCTCLNGQTGSCGAKLGSRGTCASGTTTCSGGNWGSCSIGPASKDTCDSGNDNSCNGVANELCPCLNGQTQQCGTSPGVGAHCTAGTQTCSGGIWGGCGGNTCSDFTVTSATDEACGPNCFNGTTCYWSTSVCPSGTHITSCSVTDTGGKGTCSYDSPNGTAANWHSAVSGCDGTHCVLNYCTCRQNGF